MIIDFREDHIHAGLYAILDLDKGRWLDLHDVPIFYADDEAGIYRVYFRDANGNFRPDPTGPYGLAWEERRGRIKLCLKPQYESEERAMADWNKAILDVAFASWVRAHPAPSYPDAAARAARARQILRDFKAMKAAEVEGRGPDSWRDRESQL